MEAPSINFTPIIVITGFITIFCFASVFYMGMKVQEHYHPPCEPYEKHVGYTVIDSSTILVDGDTIKKDWRPKYKRP